MRGWGARRPRLCCLSRCCWPGRVAPWHVCLLGLCLGSCRVWKVSPHAVMVGGGDLAVMEPTSVPLSASVELTLDTPRSLWAGASVRKP